jgi:hypothetical protein
MPEGIVGRVRRLIRRRDPSPEPGAALATAPVAAPVGNVPP